jgi:hypothetical protein
VVYVDVDPVAVAHSQALLAGNENTAVIRADLREPEEILAHPQTRRLIDPTRSTGLLLVAVLHFLADGEDPWGKVTTLRDALAPGSYVVIGHATDEGNPKIAKAFEKVYNRRVSTNVNVRSRSQILRFFDGFEFLDPGLVYIPQWRPGSPGEPTIGPGDLWGELVGSGRKP